MSGKLIVKGKLRNYLWTPMILGFLMILVDAWVFLLDIRAGMVLAGFVFVYMVTILLMMIFSRPGLTSELISFATEYGQIQKELLKELELPHALLDESGKVIWMNTAFEKLVDRDKTFRKSITSIFPEINRDRLPKGEEVLDYDVTIADGEYQMRMKRIGLSDMALLSDMNETDEYDGYLIAVYLFDETALKLALKEVDNQSLVMGLIYIDNYEEAMESVEDIGRSLLSAFIDRQVNQYVSTIDGIVRKTEKDKYLVIMRKSALAKLKEDKFRLLEDVKNINMGNATAVTLSIGIGVDGLSYAQNSEFARNAIDVALGRGGDQAVVKSPSGILYYGGKSPEKGNNARVKARVKAQALAEIISTKEKVFVMGHRNGDVDSFGASVGIACACENLDKECHIVLNTVNPSLQPLVDLVRNGPDYKEGDIIDGQEALEIADGNTALVIVDVNRPSITECPDLIRRCKAVVVLDHHRAGAEIVENATLSYVEPYASSACEMVAEILQYIKDGLKLTDVVADSLYSGIVMDTQNFIARTGVRTFEAAAYLRRNGADVTRVRKMFRDDATDYRAKAEVTRHAEVYRKSYAISVCPSDNLKNPTVTAAQAANDLLNIGGIKASFVMVDYQGKIYISARAIDEVNVQIVMEKLGGGGHSNMAGAQLEGTTTDAAIVILKNTLDTMIKEGEI